MDLASIEAAIPALRRYAWFLLRDGPGADDLVQDCLVRALDQRDKWRGGNVRAWLFGIMHNLHVSRWRRLSLRRMAPLSELDSLSVAPQQPIRVELRAVLESVAALPEPLRQVLLLVCVEELDYAAVADVLGIPIGTVMSRLSRARERIRRPAVAAPALRRVK